MFYFPYFEIFFKCYKRKKLLTFGHVGLCSKALGDVTKYFVLGTDTHLVDISERAKSFEMLKGQLNTVIMMYLNIQGGEMSENRSKSLQMCFAKTTQRNFKSAVRAVTRNITFYQDHKHELKHEEIFQHYQIHSYQAKTQKNARAEKAKK